MLDMPKSRLKLPPLKLATTESIGERLSRLRKERGLTQVELAKKIGLTQALITSYECERLRLHAEMLSRFAVALGVSADVILGLPKGKEDSVEPPKISLKFVRRMQKIEELPDVRQKALLQTIDAFLGQYGQ